MVMSPNPRVRPAVSVSHAKYDEPLPIFVEEPEVVPDPSPPPSPSIHAPRMDIWAVITGLCMLLFFLAMLFLLLSPNAPSFLAHPRTPACNPAYPTICLPVNGKDLNCSDIPYHDFQVLLPDPYHLDSDHDGIGCEERRTI
jgi:hypothetical protein